RALAEPARDATKRAAELYDEGKRHYDIGEYPLAIASWKQAYLVSSAPLLLFNLGQAYRLSGDCAQANRFYLNYKRAEPKPKNKLELDKAMTKCKGIEPASGDPPDDHASIEPVDEKPAIAEATVGDAPKPDVVDRKPVAPAPRPGGGATGG